MKINADASPEIHFNITSESISLCLYLKHHLSFSDIQTLTFPIPSSFFTKDRRFYVSASDGRITKKTALIKIDSLRQPLVWNENLDGL